MRWITRSPSIHLFVVISILFIFLLSLTTSPVFAEENPPPDPTPTAEAIPADDDSPGEEPTIEEIPEEAMTDSTELPEAEANSEIPPAPEEEDSSVASLVVDADALPATSVADPYFTLGGLIYRFSSGATYCTDNGFSNCTQGLPSPIQSAINYLSTNNIVPDDSTVYVENGIYIEDDVIDGGAWTSTPSSLAVQSLAGSGSTTIQGTLTIQNMLDFLLQGFTVTGGITATGNTGTLTMSDVVTSNTSGTGIIVDNQDGDVVLEAVQSDGNANLGASIDNTAGSGDVTITDSQFNDNNTTAVGGQQGGLDVNSDGTVTLERVDANANLDGDGASITADTVVVNGGSFNQNTSPSPGFGNGLAAQSTGGSITVSGMTASNNEESGALLWYPTSAADPANLITVEFSRFKSNGDFGVWAQPESGTVILKCNCTSGNGLGGSMVPVGETVLRYACPDKDDKETGQKYKYVGVLLSTEKPKVVNATNGVLVTFPPITIIDPAELAIGKAWPLKKHELPAEIPEEDSFMAGVEIQMLNAEFIEGLEDGELLIEFFIPGYLVEREFSVLWWDTVVEEWVEVPFEFVPHFRLPGGKITVNWPETGTFILVLHPESM